MKNTRLSFIGGGNMARSLIGGLLQNDWPANQISVADPNPEQGTRLHQINPAIILSSDNIAAAKSADVLVFATKPQVLQSIAREVADSVQKQRPLIVSIAAGIYSADIDRWLGKGLPIVRCMPNTPALVQSGATGLFANKHVSEPQKELAEKLLRSVGITVWLDEEKQLDIVTALSGSGPAYIFLVIEAMQTAAEQMGLTSETARMLSIETVFGSAKLALESEDEVATLRERVTSKGGTTEKALQVLENGDLRNLFYNAMKGAEERAEKLAEQLGKDSL
ncbi:MAG: pyrroline-5-carboxylate reductase [Thiothrix sp.]|nr:MAG: pyrroline-5-carboxylate reductase [Thiothrix sp.]